MSKMINSSRREQNRDNWSKYVTFIKHKDYVEKAKNDIFIETKQTWQGFHSSIFLKLPNPTLSLKIKRFLRLMTIEHVCWAEL